jgi:adenylate cyclase
MKDRLFAFFSVSPLKISILVIFVAVVLFLTNNSFFYFMELKTLDIRFLSRGNRVPGGEVAIAVVDEKSLSELGRWPWPRTVIARLIETLKKDGAKTVGFDVVFAEPDENSSLRELTEVLGEMKKSGIGDGRVTGLLEERKERADTDAAMARAVADAGNVTLGYFFLTDPKEIGHLSESAIEEGRANIVDSKYQIVQFDGQNPSFPLIEAYAATPNIPVLSEAAENSGYFNYFPDRDGSIRWSPLVIRFREDFYPSLAIASIEQYMDWPPVILKIADYGVRGVQLGDVFIPTDEAGRMIVNYLGPSKTFPHYSISDILNGRVPPERFRDKIVLVGVTATGIYDLRVTPFSTVFPGIEIHASVIDNILHRNFLRRPGWTAIIDLAAVVVLGLVIVPFLSRLRAVAGLLLALLVSGLYVMGNRFVFSHYNLWLNLVYPLFTILAVYVGITLYKYVTEEREKKKIRGAFQYYLSPAVISEILNDPAKLKLGGEKKSLTVLFSDIRGFTSLSEKLTPEELVHILNEYLTSMTNVVFRHEGLLDKYIGDAVMAVFGAPIDQKDHAERGCRTALEMMAELRNLCKKWEAEGRPVIDIGIGVNSGDMVVGNMGSDMRFDYTVMGDHVNLGSRLEGLNKEYGTNILISEFTHEMVKDVFFCRSIDAVRVKGKVKPVRIFEVLGEMKDREKWEERARLFEEALEWYRKGSWDEAVAGFRKVLERCPGDPPSKIYVERCGELKSHPPEQWDGVYTMTKK